MKNLTTNIKIKLLLMALLFVLAGCSLFSSGPRATLEKFLLYAEEYNLDGMFSLISDKAIKEMGADRIKNDNEKFSDAISNGKYKMQIISETITGDTAKIIFFYKDAARNDSVRLGFKFVKQNGDWKIDNYGFGDPDGDPDSDPSPDIERPTPSSSNEIEPPAPVVQKTNSNSNPAKKPPTTVDPKKNIFTATELAVLFRDHPDEAEKAYYSKVITIKGKVFKEDDKGNSFKFRIEPPENEGIEHWDFIADGFLSADKPKVAKFKPGQEVTVKCKVDSHNSAGISLHSCDLQ